MRTINHPDMDGKTKGGREDTTDRQTVKIESSTKTSVECIGLLGKIIQRVAGINISD